MTGDDAPEVKSFNDYLTHILPVCFGPLNMTAEEIRNSTPWEINMRIKGYEDRQRQKRFFAANYLTLPVLNSGFMKPKHGLYELKDVLPADDLATGKLSKEEADMWHERLDTARKELECQTQLRK